MKITVGNFLRGPLGKTFRGKTPLGVFADDFEQLIHVLLEIYVFQKDGLFGRGRAAPGAF
jgi:hypothetical protein